MGNSDTKTEERRNPRRPRYIFQIDSDSEGHEIRIVDSETGDIFREIPIAEFLEFAKRSTRVRDLFFGPVS